MSFRAIIHLETMALSVALWRQRREFDKGEDPVRVLDVWGKFKSADWKAAQSVTARALNALAAFNHGERPELLAVTVQKIMPKSDTPWALDTELAETTLRFRVPISTNPLCINYCGLMTASLPVGQLTQEATDLLSSWVNHGEHGAYHLVIEVRRPEGPVDEPKPAEE